MTVNKADTTQTDNNPKPQKIRADQLLIQRDMVPSRHQAQSLILAGRVFTAKERVEKAGQLVWDNEEIRIEEDFHYVSRGGDKLEHALKVFDLDPEGKVCLDIGASTGGFTDCMLQEEAKIVYAVDVGYGQLHWRIRQNKKVVALERTNFRYIQKDKIPDKVDLVTIDVSFISLEKILPKVGLFIHEKANVVTLVKPQFELSPEEVKKGIVRSEELREKAVAKVKAIAKDLGYQIKDETRSPVVGGKGNHEFFLHLIPKGKLKIKKAVTSESVQNRLPSRLSKLKTRSK